MDKKLARQTRARKTRARIAEQRIVRLCVNRTNSHIYAQLISADGSKIIASASTAEAAIRAQSSNGGNKSAAATVGTSIAQKAKAAGVERVAFDRSGFRFHGRIKALADAAREAGLQF
jgi:large subunit ribosomal protein L18